MAGIRDSKTVDGVTYNYLTLDGKVVRQTWGSNVLDIIYDNSGLPYALKYNGAYYIYVMNQQGDVIRIVNSTGATVAEYRYDAWGNVIYSNGSMAAVNPIRYRGYYYDTETGFYYLQSRYYDPSIGRFINADSFASTGQGFVGYNVFAYCNNNPTNLTDSSGNLPKWFEDGLKWLNNKVGTILKVAEDIWTDIARFDIDNQSEQKVLVSNYFSYYKGCMVFRTDGNRSGSFGALFITRETNNREHPEDMVRHEYGHTLQLKELGVINYTLCIGIPSYFEWGSGEYYSKPWEITADAYGRVLYRNHDTSDIMDGFAYLDTSKKIGPLIWLFIDG